MDWSSVYRPFKIGGRVLRRKLMFWRPHYRNFSDSVADVFGSLPEIEISRHVPAERAELYRCVDEGSTELEVLNFLNALIFAYKPRLVLETGCYHGMGAIAIASALQPGGRLLIDPDPGAIRISRRNIWMYDHGLLARVEFCQQESLKFLENYQGSPFEAAFLDSLVELRGPELQVMLRRNLLAPGAVVMIHDTSRLRSCSPPFAEHELLDGFGGLEFPFSRGFRVIVYQPNRQAPTQRKAHAIK